MPITNLPDIRPNDITEFSRDELGSWLAEHSFPAFRVGQIFRWLYRKHATSFDDMTDIAKIARSLLSEYFQISRMAVNDMEISRDGSRKFLFGLHDGNTIETVLIPEKDHYTLCISTQAGCAMGCRFCMTARGGLIRNLTQGEIIGQVLHVRRRLEDTDKPLTNIVLMGMGEPLANFDNVVRALDIMTTDRDGLDFSTRRVTLSTAGLIPRFRELGARTRVNLAVSLNAADNITRSRLMPINDPYPIEALVDACARYPLAPRGKITFEYILIRGVNDSPRDARNLSKLLRPVKAKINLIPFNEHPACDFRQPEEAVILKFQEILAQKQYTVMIRRSKGSDISAACGQLSGKGREINGEDGGIARSALTNGNGD